MSFLGGEVCIFDKEIKKNWDDPDNSRTFSVFVKKNQKNHEMLPF